MTKTAMGYLAEAMILCAPIIEDAMQSMVVTMWLLLMFVTAMIDETGK